MSDPIVSVADIEHRARAAYASGKSLDDCPLNWHSCAYETWAGVYAQLEAEEALARAQHQEQEA